MNFLKKLFGGGDKKPADSGVYLYIRCDKCGEVIRIRLEPKYEFVAQDDGSYRSRKVIIGSQCFTRIDATFHFDPQQQLLNADLNGGQLVDESEWTPPSPAAGE